ncbi:uncharacterized protein LTR77_007910 [Saxophila tyrrhenica]|uniref:Non-repetitive nucleoporin n=1 Tax=Saxophila tyrrhenica TaxID=1690608 RepID=A0AAV9P789_9PEZI|nr:hypothetical protein LTR77_007910 [Saxophila tyrrhenica]
MAAAAGPATPQRPLPGMFMATPAPPAPTIFAANAASLRQNPQPAQAQPNSSASASSQSVEPIELAARKINDTLAGEERFPQLEDYVTQGISGEYELSTNPAWTPYQKLSQYELPAKLLDQTNHSGLALQLGIFPAIGHAWAALDNCLYLWDYTLPNPEIIGYEEQSHTITSVDLALPQAGVFIKEVAHLIVLTTTADMQLLGVAANTAPSGNKTIQLYNTKMSIPVRGLAVEHVVSTKTGRIFFVGSFSEDIYEFRYQQNDGWFTSKTTRICHTKTQFSMIGENTSRTLGSFLGGQKAQAQIKQMVVDDSRDLFYTLSTRDEIKVWRIQPELSCAVMRSMGALRQNLSHMMPRSELLENCNLASLSAIPATEASRVALVATTTTGCRLYISLTRGNWYGGGGGTGRDPPNSMQILHVRFPPSDPNLQQQSAGSPSQPGQNAVAPYGAQGSTVDLNSQVLKGTEYGLRLPPGNFLASLRSSPGQGRLFCAATDAGRVKNYEAAQMNRRFPEFGMFIDLPGDFYRMIDTSSQPYGATGQPAGFGNELATQFDQPSTEIAIVTSSAIQMIRRRRLVDMFAAMMKYRSTDDGLEGEVKRFISRYGRDEMAATALAVACGQGIDVASDSRLTSITDPEVREGARKAFTDYGGDPEFNANALTTNNANPVDNVRPSPRCIGMALYISRLVRSIWRKPIILETVAPGQAVMLTSTVGAQKLRNVQEALTKLYEFLDANKSFINGLNGAQAASRGVSRQTDLANQGEAKHMDSLMKLIPRMIEGIAFVLTLFENKLEDILAGLGDESRQKAKQLTYESLFVSSDGRELAKELVKAIVNLNIANGSNVDTVAEALRRKCGSFCSADDVVIFKAQEQVKRASEAGGQSETGRVLLNESQRLFQKVAPSLSDDHLKWATEQYVNMAFYAGAIQLCLVVAGERDRAKAAAGWLKDGRPENDPRKDAFEKRERCFHLAFAVIEALDAETQSVPERMEGQYTVAAKRRNEAYDVVNTSDDAVFQTCLYDWYIGNSQSDRLLDIQGHYVTDYLTRRAQEGRGHADLLWRYYAHHNDYLQAASVQLDLARGFFELSLEERIEYLSRARTNASTRQTALMDSRQSKQQLLREISDLLDVANIQDDILQRMKSEPRLTGQRREEVLKELNGTIRPIDELYNQYADQAAYHDICLYIYQVADHRNPADIKTTWQNLINQTDDASQAVYARTALSWELVGEKVREVGRRLNVSDATFPIQILLPMLQRYAIAAHDQKPPPTWALDLFLSLDIPHETLLPVMEQMYYGNEHPFVGAKRKVLASQMVYLMQGWFEESERRGERVPFGNEENLSVVSDLVAALLRTGDLEQGARSGAEHLLAGVQRAMR